MTRKSIWVLAALFLGAGCAPTVNPECDLGDDAADCDGDNLTNGEEFSGESNSYDGEPTDPEDADSDNDGLEDDEEREIGTNPLSYDTDRDGIEDGEERENNTDPLDPEDY